MRAVLQRVSAARVTVGGEEIGAIGSGLLLLLGVAAEDTEDDVCWLVGRILALRLFADEAGRLDRSLTETGGGLLVVSQFTLLASMRKGTRPSFHLAARPEVALPLYERFCALAAERLGRTVATGRFGAEMEVSSVNAGPVTLVLDSRRRD
ncbi:MAG: D-aminoacyl-tRNA deacylase [Opitutaceae bacterium]